MSTERIQKIHDMLAAYESQIHAPRLTQDEQCDYYLNLGPDDLRRLTGEECAVGAYMLDKRALHLQEATNKEKSVMSWVDHEIRFTAAHRVHEAKGWAFDERLMYLIKEDEFLMVLAKIKINAQVRFEKMTNIAERVSSVGKSLKNLEFAKRATRNE